jgi:hypothetical protein
MMFDICGSFAALIWTIWGSRMVYFFRKKVNLFYASVIEGSLLAMVLVPVAAWGHERIYSGGYKHWKLSLCLYLSRTDGEVIIDFCLWFFRWVNFYFHFGDHLLSWIWCKNLAMCVCGHRGSIQFVFLKKMFRL